MPYTIYLAWDGLYMALLFIVQLKKTFYIGVHSENAFKEADCRKVHGNFPCGIQSKL